MPNPSRHWPEIARLWHHVGSPLRPAPQDVAFLQGLLAAPRPNAGPEPGPLRALILGVTPELHNLAWPPHTQLRAADRTPGMIEALWPGRREAVAVAEWTALPFDPGSQDLVLCDGGLHLLSHPHGHAAWVRELHRVLAAHPAGRCVLRVFLPPDLRESADTVLDDLLHRRIPNLNVLKLRLGAALQPNPVDGVRLGDVWQRFQQAAPDFDALARHLGWDPDHLHVINTYRDSDTRYHFLSLREIEHLFGTDPGGFRVEEVFHPSYPLGERCPTLVLRRVDAPGVRP